MMLQGPKVNHMVHGSHDMQQITSLLHLQIDHLQSVHNRLVTSLFYRVTHSPQIHHHPACLTCHQLLPAQGQTTNASELAYFSSSATAAAPHMQQQQGGAVFSMRGWLTCAHDIILLRAFRTLKST